MEDNRLSHLTSGRIGRSVTVLIVLGAGGLLLRHFADFERFVELARDAQPAWMLVALIIQAGTYLAVALGWGLVLRRAGSPQPLRALLPVAVSKLFADQALPGAGLGGHVLLVDRLTALGTARSTAMAALLISLVGYYIAYAALALLMLLALWLHHHATALLSGLITTLLLVVALAVPALALWLRRRGSEPLPPWLERLGPVRRVLVLIGEAPADLVGDRRLLALVSLLNGLVFLADSATLAACLLALRLPFSPVTAFLGLMAGSIAATLAPIPLGLGSFEASSTAIMQSLGVPFAAAFTATFLLRGLTLWLPLFPSLLMMRRGSRQKKERRS